MEFKIEEPDKKIGQEIKANWDRVAKPLDGLGEFEGLLARIGAILGSPEIDIAKKAVIVMCAVMELWRKASARPGRRSRQR